MAREMVVSLLQFAATAEALTIITSDNNPAR